MTQHYINVSKEPHLLYETDAVRMKLGEVLDFVNTLSKNNNFFVIT
jgi:hypothetical protein